MNQVGLVGRMTKDPVLRQLPDNRVQLSFTLAINRTYRNNEGNVEADFVFCSVWGKLAETVDRYCGKGSLIGVNGRLHTSTYINKEQQKVYKTEVVVEDVRFYVLKSRENQLVTQAAHSQLVVTGETPPENFVLPETEEGLPVAQL